MKQYVIDELRPVDHEKLSTHFNKHFAGTDMEGIYWIPLEDHLLTDTQAAHPECKPFYFVIELGQDRMACELLIRTKNSLRCGCSGYADENQRNWIVHFADALFEKFGIIA